ncbi:hypothetical protein [Sphingobacterium hotanense]|uniref:hypothetical protein n=1 Tax=Sphingobacterium hotanense TaxID=649196 RepID=UPI0021A8AF4E|nr:hypothetical protein [Sphingobacterium hotanense]MCT1526113.1 hypothetical protein [Sphingobacterium hotanense]
MKDRIYFKTRPRFGKSQHPFDIGMPFFWWKGHYDLHFLKRLYERTQDEFGAYYDYHLQFFLQENQGATEIEFFRHVNDIASDELGKLIADDKRESKSKHRSIVQQKKVLRAFLDHLASIDRWNTTRTKEEIIAEKESEIRELKEIVVQLTKELKEAQKLETEGYINIPDGYLLTLVDVMVKLRKQELPDGRELAFSQFAMVWVKMICRYFRENNEPISTRTIQRYFPADLNDLKTKYAEVPSKHRLFDIVPAKKRR